MTSRTDGAEGSRSLTGASAPQWGRSATRDDSRVGCANGARRPSATQSHLRDPARSNARTTDPTQHGPCARWTPARRGPFFTSRSRETLHPPRWVVAFDQPRETPSRRRFGPAAQETPSLAGPALDRSNPLRSPRRPEAPPASSKDFWAAGLVPQLESPSRSKLARQPSPRLPTARSRPCDPRDDSLFLPRRFLRGNGRGRVDGRRRSRGWSEVRAVRASRARLVATPAARPGRWRALTNPRSAGASGRARWSVQAGHELAPAEGRAVVPPW